MRSAVLIIMMFSSLAQAQGWGTGQYGGTNCNNPVQTGPGAVNGDDERANLQGKLHEAQGHADELEALQKRLDRKIQKAKEKMARVLTADAIAAVEEHRRFKNSRADYKTQCSAPARSEPSAPVNRNEIPSVGPPYGRSNSSDRRPVPAQFCALGTDGILHNTWDEAFANDDGTVSDSLCEHYIVGLSKGKAPGDRSECKDGLNDYYAAMDSKERLKVQLEKLNEQVRTDRRSLERIDDEIAEGRYCADCAARRRGYSNQSPALVAVQGAIILSQLYARSQRGQFQQPRPFNQPVNYRQPGYPVSPYTAPIPGYAGIGPNRMYGGVPGARGAGSFACQGMNPLAEGNPFADPAVLPIYPNAGDPFANPFVDAQNGSVFNPGAGPGWGAPRNGNGAPIYLDPYGNQFQINPAAQTGYRVNPNAPPVLPFGFQQSQPNYFANNPNGGGRFIMPPQGAGGNYQYGLPGYDPRFSPSMAGPLAPGPFVNPVYLQVGGGAYNGGQLNNFYSELGSLRQQILYLQTGPQFGGNFTTGGSPYVFPGPSQPFFNGSGNGSGLPARYTAPIR